MDAYTYLMIKRDAMLASSGLFWLPSGVSADNVLAAYQFKGVASESDALKDLSGHGRTLTKASETVNGTTYTPTWSASYGFAFSQAYQGKSGYLDNQTLNGLDIKCAVVRFSNLSLGNRGYLITAGGSSGTAQLMAACTVYKDEVKDLTGAGYTRYSGTWYYGSTAITSGVVGANFGSTDGLYIDGVKQTVSSLSGCTTVTSGTTWRTFGNVHANASNLTNANHAGKRIQAAVFFGGDGFTSLTAAQMKEVYERMAQI